MMRKPALISVLAGASMAMAASRQPDSIFNDDDPASDEDFRFLISNEVEDHLRKQPTPDPGSIERDGKLCRNGESKYRPHIGKRQRERMARQQARSRARKGGAA